MTACFLDEPLEQERRGRTSKEIVSKAGRMRSSFAHSSFMGRAGGPLLFVSGEHLLEAPPLFRIENLHNAAVTVSKHVVVIVGEVVEDRGELHGLLIGEIEARLPFRDGHG